MCIGTPRPVYGVSGSPQTVLFLLLLFAGVFLFLCLFVWLFNDKCCYYELDLLSIWVAMQCSADF